MNLSELHSINNFIDLFSDPRLKAALIYLREHPKPRDNVNLSDTTAIIRSEGSWQGWFEALEKLEDLKNPSAAQTTLPKSAPYTTNQPTQTNG